MTDAPAPAATPAAIRSRAKFPDPLREFFVVLGPNAIVKDRVLWALTAGWIVVLLFFWTFSHAKLLPSPLDVLRAFGEQWRQGMAQEMLSSVWTSLRAICFASVLGLSLAYASTIPLFKAPVSWIGKLRFLSLTGVSLIFVLAAPNGDALKVSLLTFAIMTFLVNDMVQVVDDIPQGRFDHARTLGLGRWRVLLEVVIRGRLGESFEAIRMNAAMAWMMLTMVETLARSGGGVGVLLSNLNRHMDLGAVFALQIAIFIVGIGQDRLIKLIKTIVCPYTALRH